MRFVGCTIVSLLLAVEAVAVQAPRRSVRADAACRVRRGGLLLSPTDLSHLRRALQMKSSLRKGLLMAGAALPSKWDSRGMGWVTPVRDQGDYGTCWAFATAAALETAELKASPGSPAHDYSENHMAAHDVGFAFGFSDGGNNQVAAALLTAWRDPLYEEDDPYPSPRRSVDLPPRVHVQDIVWLAARKCPFIDGGGYGVGPVEDNREVDAAYKRAVMEYGAVAVGYYHCNACYNSVRGTYYLSAANYRYDPNEGGHAVTLIGWDDDYPAANFGSGLRRPPGNGAFLVKNSWGGATSETGGCLWISYYDESLFSSTGAAYPPPEPTDNYGRVYQYDPCGQVSSWNVCDTQAEQMLGGFENWCANVFTASATGVVSAVGFYALADDTRYVLRVYRDCKGAPDTGGLVVCQTGTVANAGFATIRLDRAVGLTSVGGKFAVALRLECPGYDFPLPVESSDAGFCTCTAHAGESYMSRDGEKWLDFQKYVPAGNFCIKAYTAFGSDGSEERLIASAVPAAESLSVRNGDCPSFAVAAVKPSEGETAYSWRIDGRDTGCLTADFTFATSFADHGVHEVSCLVRQGELADVQRWTVFVRADLHVEQSVVVNVPDGSPDRPYPTIDAALAAAIEGDVVLVGEGCYAALEGPSARVEIRSTAGPAVTILDGGDGERCYNGQQNAETALVGFTLRRGRADEGGGALYGVLSNCVIASCRAGAGGGAFGCTLVNCLVRNNVADGLGGGACDCDLSNCTLVGNSARQNGGGACMFAGGVRNTIAALNENGSLREDICFMTESRRVYGCFIGGDAKFVDAAQGDYRLSARSPCLDAGSNAFVTAICDLAGSARIVGPRVDVGCYEYQGVASDWPWPEVARDATAAEEAAAVRRMLRENGFDDARADAIGRLPQYAAFADWASVHGKSVADMARAPTAILSAALAADGLLDLQEKDLDPQDFVPRADGGWSFRMIFPDCKPATVCPGLLKAAVGVAASTVLTGPYSEESISVESVPEDGAVVVNILPNGSPSALFMKSFLR